MNIKHVHSILPAVSAAAIVAGAATAAAPVGHASLLIRHQQRGCHTWSVNGGAFAARQTVAVQRGGSITVTNNDVMPHKLVETSGPGGRIASAAMAHMGATSKISFAHSGVYRFTTKPGEDYATGIHTIGEDYVLRLTVNVS